MSMIKLLMVQINEVMTSKAGKDGGNNDHYFTIILISYFTDTSHIVMGTPIKKRYNKNSRLN